LFDPQTAGGLLISLASDDAESLVSKLQDQGLAAAHIGEVIASTKPLIAVV
jgi:selenophosphate synthase